jgi:hypothetical protein
MDSIDEALIEVQESVVYREVDGGLVQVVKIVEDDTTKEKMVLYSEFSQPSKWKVSTLRDFLIKTLDNGSCVPRHIKTDTVIGSIGGLVLSR